MHFNTDPNTMWNIWTVFPVTWYLWSMLLVPIAVVFWYSYKEAKAQDQRGEEFSREIRQYPSITLIDDIIGDILWKTGQPPFDLVADDELLLNCPADPTNEKES